MPSSSSPRRRSGPSSRSTSSKDGGEVRWSQQSSRSATARRVSTDSTVVDRSAACSSVGSVSRSTTMVSGFGISIAGRSVPQKSCSTISSTGSSVRGPVGLRTGPRAAPSPSRPVARAAASATSPASLCRASSTPSPRSSSALRGSASIARAADAATATACLHTSVASGHEHRHVGASSPASSSWSSCLPGRMPFSRSSAAPVVPASHRSSPSATPASRYGNLITTVNGSIWLPRTSPTICPSTMRKPSTLPSRKYASPRPRRPSSARSATES